MNLASLPTDNLYKFMALAGLALALFGFWLPWSRLAVSLERLGELEAEVATATIDVDFLGKDVEIAKENRAISQAEVVELDKALRASARRFAVLQVRLSEARRLHWFVWVSVVISILLVGSGTYLSARGFYLWYHRVQKHLDAAAAKTTS